MELKDFVSETIKQIIDGVVAAEAYGKNKGARVNPLHLPVRDENGVKHDITFRADIPHDIEFDVAVTATQGTETKGGIGVFVGAIGLGSHGQSNKENES